MTIAAVARPRVATQPRTVLWALARIEAHRMLRHPAPWVGLALTVWLGYDVFHDLSWVGAEYAGLVIATSPLLLGVSLASVSAFSREWTAVAEDAPMAAATRSVARLLGGLSLVGVVAGVIGLAAGWLRQKGGLPLGDEPGRTLHAQYTLPELLQPVLLACFAVALGAATMHLLRSRLVAGIVLFVFWYLIAIMYWLFNGEVLRWVTLIQVQPLFVDAGPAHADPFSFPEDWLLAWPNEYQDYWARLVVSPALAAWHDVYLAALTMLAVAVAVPGRWRRPLLVAGALAALVAVLLQRAVTP